jgi:hypothetical protein
MLLETAKRTENNSQVARRLETQLARLFIADGQAEQNKSMRLP